MVSSFFVLSSEQSRIEINENKISETIQNRIFNEAVREANHKIESLNHVELF